MLVRVFIFAALFVSILSQAQDSLSPAELPALALPSPTVPMFSPSTLPTITARVNEVNLLLSVSDDRGRFVRDLSQSDLVISDNGEPPTKITYFQSRTDLPLRVALVIDTSDSVLYRFAFEQKAAQTFLKKVLRPQSDLALIVGFNQHPILAQPPTADLSQLSHSLRSLKTGGETALYDAITFASDKLREIPDTDPVRRVIVLVTDGEDNSSHVNLDQAVEHALRVESVMYIINAKESPLTDEDRVGERVIHHLAWSTGGTALKGRSEGDIAHAFQKIEEELRNQYAIGYTPPRHLMGNLLFHPIRILGPNGIRIRCRQGYYDK